MPKLLNINTYHYRRGGSDVVYLDHGALFEQDGWESGYFAMHHPKNLPTPWSRFFVDEIELGHSYSVARKLSIAKSIIHSNAHARAINALLDFFPADIAHVHLIRHHIAPNIFTELRKRKVPIVLTAHDLKLCCPAYRMHDGEKICEACKPSALYNCTLKRCMHGSLPLSMLITTESMIHRVSGAYRNQIDRVICPSRFYLEKHVEWGWSREQLIYIPNDFDVPSATDEIPRPGNYLCYFGRLSFEKGLGTVVKACAAAGMPLQLVGEGPELEALQQLSADVGADVVFHGRQTGDALFSVVRGARVCVLASEWYENAPKGILEAFGLGKAVIGADIGGISEMIEHGRTGWLVSMGNVEELANTLREIKSAPDEVIAEIGGNARDFVRREFSTQLYLSRMKALYAELGVK